MPIFRFHRGGLAESLETCVVVENVEHLAMVISHLTDFKPKPSDIVIIKYGHGWDVRIGWYTHTVMINDAPIGFLSESFIDENKKMPRYLKPRSDFEILGTALVIRDLNRGRMSVTNDAENVVTYLLENGFLKVNQRLFYYDSNNDLSEIIWGAKK